MDRTGIKFEKREINAQPKNQILKLDDENFIHESILNSAMVIAPI